MSLDLFVLAVMQIVICGRLNSLESAEEGIETIFDDFCHQILGKEEDIKLQRVIEFVQQFCSVGIYYGPPVAMRTNSEHYISNHYEDFLSLMNFNSTIPKFIGSLELE